MPKKSRRSARRQTPDGVGKRIALNERIAALQTEMTSLRRARAVVSRDEFKEVVNSLRLIQRNTDDIAEHTRMLATQVTRMGQMQAEIDVMHRAIVKLSRA